MSDSEPAEKQTQPTAMQPASNTLTEVSNQNSTGRPSLSLESNSRFGQSDIARTNTAGYSSSAAASAAATEAADDKSTTALPSKKKSQMDSAVGYGFPGRGARRMHAETNFYQRPEGRPC